MSEEQPKENKILGQDNSDNNWALGIALIILGSLFMLDTFDILNINLHNWWAIFILIPGLNMAVKGWREYRETYSSSSRNTGFWGLVLIVLAIAFFFNISWNLIFPIGLVGVGVYLLFFR
jgi:hypothetical protein